MNRSDTEGGNHRAYDLDRTIMFSDGVFAIAITLLVLSIEVPHLSGSFGHQWDQMFGKLPGSEATGADQFFAYFLSFAVIGKFWLGHHRMFGYLDRVDARLIGLNLVYLAFIALTPFSTQLLGDESNHSLAVMTYAMNLALLGVASTLMWVHAFGAGLIVRDRLPAEGRQLQVLLIVAPWLIFLASIPVALVSTSWAEWMWVLIFFIQPHFINRVRRRLLPNTAAKA